MNKKILTIVLATLIASGIGAISMMRSTGAPVVGPPFIYGKYNFLVEIDGIMQAGFSEVEGLNVTVDVWEYREGNEPRLTPRLEPDLAHYGPLVLRWGLTENTELWDWMEKTLDGCVEKKNLAVVILNQRREEVARYFISDAWPSGWSLGKLDSQGIGPVIEELVIQYEALERESSG